MIREWGLVSGKETIGSDQFIKSGLKDEIELKQAEVLLTPKCHLTKDSRYEFSNK